MNVILEKKWLQKSVVLTTESVANENSVCLFYNKVALLAEFLNSFFTLQPPFGKCNV